MLLSEIHRNTLSAVGSYVVRGWHLREEVEDKGETGLPNARR